MRSPRVGAADRKATPTEPTPAGMDLMRTERARNSEPLIGARHACLPRAMATPARAWRAACAALSAPAILTQMPPPWRLLPPSSRCSSRFRAGAPGEAFARADAARSGAHRRRRAWRLCGELLGASHRLRGGGGGSVIIELWPDPGLASGRSWFLRDLSRRRLLVMSGVAFALRAARMVKFQCSRWAWRWFSGRGPRQSAPAHETRRHDKRRRPQAFSRRSRAKLISTPDSARTRPWHGGGVGTGPGRRPGPGGGGGRHAGSEAGAIVGAPACGRTPARDGRGIAAVSSMTVTMAL